MRMKIETGEKTTLTLLILFTMGLTAYTTIVLANEFFMVPLSQVAVHPISGLPLQGYATNIVSEIDAETYSFDFYLNDLFIDNYEITHPLKEGDQITKYVLSDPMVVPVIYQPRQWIQIYVNGEMVWSNERHLPLGIARGLWVATLLGGLSIPLRRKLRIRDWFKNSRPPKEELLKDAT